MTTPTFLPVIEELGDLPKGTGETFLIYGPSGSGKTRLAATIGRALFVNIGGGISTLQAPGFRKIYSTAAKDLKVVTIEEQFSRNGRYDVATMFDQVCDTIDHSIAHLRDQIDAVIVDDATSLRRGAMAKALLLNAKTGKSQSAANSKALRALIYAQQDYGGEMDIVNWFADTYTKICKSNGLHFVMTAHERLTFKKGNQKNGEEANVLIRTAPAFTGVDKNPDQITGHFDQVWHTRVVGAGDNRKFRIDCIGSETLIAKTRWEGLFKPVEENLDLATAIKRIRESK